MDLAGIRNSDGVALIEMDLFSAQVAWLHESIAPGKSPKEMKQWLSDYYKSQKLTEEEMNSLIERSKYGPKVVPKDFLYKLSILIQPLYIIIDNMDSE